MSKEYERIKFAPSILARLGEELLPNVEQGFIELVRNSYDADATECTIFLSCINQPGGRVIVTDNGSGMTVEHVRNGWLVLGKSSKATKELTTRGRIPIGDKGLGRLAALRMGQYVFLRTYPEVFPGARKANRCVSVFLDWEAFDNASLVDDVVLEIKEIKLAEEVQSGTEIIVDEIAKPITKRSIQELARSLSLLANPFEGVDDFSLNLVAPGYPKLEKIVRQGYLDDAELVLRAEIKEDGSGIAEVVDGFGQVMWSSSSLEWNVERKTYAAPASKFELWVFILDSITFATRDANVAEVRRWLKSVGGVHFYYRNFRVHPYGDPGYDWLDINLSRARSPELRPSTNTVIGRVVVPSDPKNMLIQKTDRLGFIESEAFSEIKRFATDALNWMARKRLQLREAVRQQEFVEAKKQEKSAKAELQIILEKEVASDVKEKLKKVFEAVERESVRKEKHYQDDLQLYRSLATAGTSTAVFSHEIGKPLAEVPKIIQSISIQIEKEANAELLEKYKARAKTILDYLGRLGHFARLQLDLLKRDKRRSGRIDVNKTVQEIAAAFEPMLTPIGINLETLLAPGDPGISGTVTLVEAVLTNCLTNCVRAFQMDGARTSGRRVLVAVEADEGKVRLLVSDNGPGIQGIDENEIWLPGRTTIPGGTGFGLTIVRDSVRDLGGTAGLLKEGRLGGAEFFFEFPAL